MEKVAQESSETGTIRRGASTITQQLVKNLFFTTTLKQLMQAMGWQAHSVRGFVSGTLGKKMGLTVASTKGEDGEGRYSGHSLSQRRLLSPRPWDSSPAASLLLMFFLALRPAARDCRKTYTTEPAQIML